MLPSCATNTTKDRSVQPHNSLLETASPCENRFSFRSLDCARQRANVECLLKRRPLVRLPSPPSARLHISLSIDLYIICIHHSICFLRPKAGLNWHDTTQLNYPLQFSWVAMYRHVSAYTQLDFAIRRYSSKQPWHSWGRMQVNHWCEQGPIQYSAVHWRQHSSMWTALYT